VSTPKRRKRSHSTQYAGWIIAILLAVVAYARHAHTAEFVLAALATGLIVGAVLGSGRRPVIVQPAPRKKAAPAPRKPAAQKPKRVVHRDVDADVLLAEMEDWSDDCVDGRCGECSGKNPEGGTCTHCNHPGRRRGPGKDLDLGNDEIPY
jgi:hypothetical protein